MSIKVNNFFIFSNLNESLFAQRMTNSLHPTKTFIFVHGLAGDSQAYFQLTQEVLAIIPDSQCISYDLRGYGFSSYKFPENREYFSLQSEDLQQIVQYFQETDIYLLGQSKGANIVAHFIQRFPNDFKKIKKAFLVAFIPSEKPFLSEKMVSALIKKIKLMSMQKKKRPYEEILKYKNSFDYSIARALSDIKSIGLKRYILYWLPVFTWKNSTWDKQTVRKIVYIFGVHDYLIPRYFQKKFIKKYPTLKYYEIDTNHNAVVNAPETIAHIIFQEIQ